MAAENLISILIAAKDEASKVIEGAAAKTKVASAEANSSLGSTATAAEGTGKSFGMMGLAVAAAAVVIAGVAIKSAGDYQSALVRLTTSAGESTSNLKLVGDGMLVLARDTGTSTKKLTDAMYLIESAGLHGADGLLVLKAAAQGAKAENANVATVADAVSSVLQDYHLKASDAAMVTSKLIVAIGDGKTNFEEFASSLAAVLPIASAAHVSLSDTTAALASMTVHGMSAEQASQNLAHAIGKMQSPTQAMTKYLAQIGISSDDLANRLGQKGITGTLQDISQAIMQHMGPSGRVLIDSFNQSKSAAEDANKMIAAMPTNLQALAKQFQTGQVTAGGFRKEIKALPVDQANLMTQFSSLQNSASGFNSLLKSGSPEAKTYAAALYAATGDATTLNAALMLTGENTAYVNKAVKDVSGATVEAGGNVRGWSEVQGTFNNKLQRLGEFASTGAIALGTVLLPVASAAIDIFLNVSQVVADLGNKFGIYILPVISPLAFGFVMVAKAIEAIPKAIQGAIGWLDRVKTYLAVHMPNSVAIAHQAMGLLGRGFQGAEDIIDKFGDKFNHANSKMNDFVGDGLTKVKSELKEHFPDAAAKAKAALIDLSDPGLLVHKVIGKIKDAIAKFDEWVGIIHASLIKFKNEALEEARKKVEEFRDKIEDLRNWFDKNKSAIEGVATVLGVVFGPALAKAAVEAAIKGASIGGSGIAAGARWVAGAVAASYAWAVNSAKSAASSGKTAVLMSLDAVKTGYTWTLSALKSSGIWVASMAKMVLTTAVSSVKMTLSAADTGWAWMLNGIRMSAVWVAQFAVVAREAVATGIKVAAQAAISGGAWIAQAAKAAFAWVVTELPKIVTGAAVTSASAVTQAGISSGAWIASAAKSSFAWVVTELPKIVAAFIAASGSAIAQAAISSTAWVAAAVTSSASYTAFAALLSTPLVMPAIVVAAALAAIALVLKAVQEVTGAINAMNDLKSAQSANEQVSQDLVKSAKSGLAAGRITQAQYDKDITLARKKAPDVGWFDKLLTGKLALGTNFATGGRTLVGENGPEIVDMPHGSRVTPTRESQKLMGGGGASISINNLNINNNMDEQKFLKSLGWKLSL